MTFFKNLPSNSLPTGKSFQSIATKFPHPGLHIAVHPKAGPKKGTIKRSPNKTLQSLFINVTASPKIHDLLSVKLKQLGLSPYITNRYLSFLEGRKQRLFIYDGFVGQWKMLIRVPRKEA